MIEGEGAIICKSRDVKSHKSVTGGQTDKVLHASILHNHSTDTGKERTNIGIPNPYKISQRLLSNR